jgi:molecular chaperone DnaK
MDFTPLRIRLPFGNEEEFIARYGVHVGRDGFFLATKNPKDVGAQLAFELVLADGTALLSGEGVVARTVAGARTGMVVRFLRLDGAGTALVERILAARRNAASEKSSSEVTTWHGDPTRDVARVTGPAGAPLPSAKAAAEKRRGVELPKEKEVPPDEEQTWPGDPTRDVVRFAPSDRRPGVNGPLAEAKAPPDAPNPKPDNELPFHLRPTPALGVPETQVHTAITPVRGIPALGPEVVAFLSGRTPTVKTDSVPLPPPAVVRPTVEVDTQSAKALDMAPSSAVPASGQAVPAEAEAPAQEALGVVPTLVAPAPAPPDPEPATPLVEPPRTARVPLVSDAIPLPSPSTVQPLPVARPPATPSKPSPPQDAPAPSTPAGESPRPVETRTEAATPLLPLPGPAAAAGPSPEPGVAAAVLGLHVGTSCARMAWVHDGRADVLAPDADGNAQALVCRLVRDAHGVLRALQPGESEEALWVGSPVSLLGTRADSPAVRTLVRRWPVPMVADERGEVAFDWAGVTVTAVELVAALLRSLRAAAERHAGRPCTQAVLVVPVTFTLLQRARFREAAERAGLSVLRLLNAPTAAALAFTYDKGMARRRVLVWRMGAATSDAAVVAVSGNDLDVVSCGGDGALGGVNFDEQLALSLDKLARTDPARLRMRVAQAERCKQTLSTSERGLVPPAAAGEPSLEVSRADLELRTAALVERSVLLAQDVLRASGLSAENLDGLVLTGGMSQMAHLRRAVETAFGKTAVEMDATASPALGAALLGATLSSPAVSGRARSTVAEVLGVPLEAVAPEFGHQRAFERNTRLPAEKTLTLVLPANQPLEVQLFQGMARAPDPRSFLGLLQSPGVERPGEWALHLGLSADGLLQAAVTPPGGKRRPLTLQAAPAPVEAEASSSGTDETDPGARLLGGLKRLFTKK